MKERHLEVGMAEKRIAVVEVVIGSTSSNEWAEVSTKANATLDTIRPTWKSIRKWRNGLRNLRISEDGPDKQVEIHIQKGDYVAFIAFPKFPCTNLSIDVACKLMTNILRKC